MKILFTAFKGVHNTSFQLVDQTAANHILLTNSFQGLEKDISFISSDYSIVYMFGVDKKLIDKVRIETCAKYNDETVCTDFNVAVFRATNPGCYEPNPVQRDLGACAFSATG